MNKHLISPNTFFPSKQSKPKMRQYFTLASMSALLTACGTAATPTPTPTTTEVTFTTAQIKALFDSGSLKTIIGDGTTELIISNDDTDIDLDFSGVDMQNISQLTIPAGVTMVLDQADLKGMSQIVGAGSVKAGAGTSNVGAIVQLSSLNGANGFKLNGEATYDSSGRSVSSTGDVNDDGFDDANTYAATLEISTEASIAVVLQYLQATTLAMQAQTIKTWLCA